MRLKGIKFREQELNNNKIEKLNLKMKKTTLAAILILMAAAVNAQSYIGYHSDNYNGVHGLIYNPANIADSRFKTDINLIGASAILGNDYYGDKFGYLFD